MKIDRVIRDAVRTLRQVLQALDNNITVNDNFGKSGAPANSVITSVGEEQVPQWKSLAEIVADDPSLKGDPGEDGQDGQDGQNGQDGADGTSAEFDKIMTADFGSGTEIMFDHDGNVMYIE